MLFRQAIDEFLLYLQIEKNYSLNTVDGYAYDLRCFENFLIQHGYSVQLNDITKTHVRRFIQHQITKENVKPRTIYENLIDNDFMIGIDTPKTDSKLPTYMSLLELQKLFRFLEQDNSRMAMRNHLLFKLLATTGMRRSEIVEITWEQIDLSNNTIRIYGKGKKERLLPLHPMVVPLMKSYMGSLEEYQLHPSQPVFLNKNGKKMNPRGLHKIFKEILQKAGLPPQRFSLHHLRHTFATLLIQENKENVDLRTVQELLGHESLVTTQVYTHIDFEQKKKAIETFNIF
ncbi:tyrosine-type recombinase/integrase [Bacillus smithii]|uniref:tyrosine-type recombinase/integrase n=1 Tax=Bacillus smithii TaxID=1479 RepID=UPI003D218664